MPTRCEVLYVFYSKTGSSIYGLLRHSFKILSLGINRCCGTPWVLASDITVMTDTTTWIQMFVLLKVPDHHFQYNQQHDTLMLTSFQKKGVSLHYTHNKSSLESLPIPRHPSCLFFIFLVLNFIDRAVSSFILSWLAGRCSLVLFPHYPLAWVSFSLDSRASSESTAHLAKITQPLNYFCAYNQRIRVTAKSFFLLNMFFIYRQSKLRRLLLTWLSTTGESLLPFFLFRFLPILVSDSNSSGSSRAREAFGTWTFFPERHVRFF